MKKTLWEKFFGEPYRLGGLKKGDERERVVRKSLTVTLSEWDFLVTQSQKLGISASACLRLLIKMASSSRSVENLSKKAGLSE